VEVIMTMPRSWTFPLCFRVRYEMIPSNGDDESRINSNEHNDLTKLKSSNNQTVLKQISKMMILLNSTHIQIEQIQNDENLRNLHSFLI
jgi:hypothetical protein